LNIEEGSGTAAGANSGSIIIDHENAGGASSITFRSRANRGSDYGYIQYQDALQKLDVTGNILASGYVSTPDIYVNFVSLGGNLWHNGSGRHIYFILFFWWAKLL